MESKNLQRHSIGMSQRNHIECNTRISIIFRFFIRLIFDPNLTQTRSDVVTILSKPNLNFFLRFLSDFLVKFYDWNVMGICWACVEGYRLDVPFFKNRIRTHGGK